MELTWPRALVARRHAAPAPAREPRGIRELTNATAAAIVALLALATAALGASGLDTRQATDAWLRATRARGHADAALVAHLTQRRQSDLWFTTREPEREQQREEAAGDLERELGRARALAESPEERALVDLAIARSAEYAEARQRIEARVTDVGELVRRMRGYADGVARPLEALRALEARKIDAAYGEIRRSIVLTDVISGGLVVVFIAALAVLLFGTRRAVVAPVLALHRAIEGFRRGELGARAPEGGAREVRDLSRAYNAMADTLAAQREGQLSYLAGVAHDLRNPLGAMKVAVSLVGADPKGERVPATLRLLDRQVDRISRMVDDLLEVTRIEAGQIKLELQRLDLRWPSRDAIALHAPSYPAHEIVLSESPAPVWVRADPLRIDQVLTNLLTNALKFSPQGSRVDVRVFARRREAVIEVQDRGIGMTADEVSDLFAPFRRRAPAMILGAGLGLSVVRRIVQAHGGRVEVESRPGVGSTFRVVLRLDDEEGARGRPLDRG